MLTRDTNCPPRVKNLNTALFILRSKFLFRSVIFLSGLPSVWKSWSNGNGKKAKFPHKRIKTIFSLFLKKISDGEGKKNSGAITKEDILYGIDFINKKLEKKETFFASELISHLKNTVNQKALFERSYFERFIRNLAEFELKREFLPQKLMAITFDINSHCNLNCNHCFAASTKKVSAEIDYEILRKTLADANEIHGCRFFNVLGGEPLLSMERLTKLMSDFRYVPFQIFTNGTLINDNTVAELENYPNASILLSIEGEKQVNDDIRGEGTFDIVMASFERLKNSKLIYGASITVTKKNYMHVSSKKFADLLKEIGCYYVWIFDYKPIGRAGDNSLKLDADDKNIFNERIAKINKSYPYVVINSEKDPDIIGGCPATKGTILHIAANGAVMPCISIRHSSNSLNISDLSLKQIMDSEIFKEYRQIDSLKGCAQQNEPKKFNEWIQKHKLGPMYN